MSAIEAVSTTRIRQAAPLAHWTDRFAAVITGWFRIARTRKQLAGLSDEALADIGLTRDAALAEAMRPFWDQTRFRA